MIKTFPIEFLRKTLEQTLLEQHCLDNKYFGGKDQISLSSFYQQLKSQDEVDRFVETFRDLSEQQNRMNLIGNGILMSPENPTITNLYSSLIIPFSWTCSIRVLLENRDQMLDTINNLIKELKGRKVDIAQLNSVNENGFQHSEPFMVGTLGENDGEPQLENSVFIGKFENAISKINYLLEKGVIINKRKDHYLYCEHNDKLKVAELTFEQGENIVDGVYEDEELDVRTLTFSLSLLGTWTQEDLKDYYNECSLTLYGGSNVDVNLYDANVSVVETFELNDQTYTKIELTYTLEKDAQEINPSWNGSIDVEDEYMYQLEPSIEIIENDGTYDDIIFPPEHDSFEKYKLSLSFDSLRCDTPKTLNAGEYCEISFGGSATLVNNGVQLGNDLLKISFTKYLIKAETPVDFTQLANNKTYWLEPLEMPSGSNADTRLSQLIGNKFINKSHTDSINLTLQYTFIADFNNEFLEQLFDYARYGTQGTAVDKISPNIIYTIHEIWCSWGDYKDKEIKAKIVENVDIENTESDTLTLSLTMQIQGEEQ